MTGCSAAGSHLHQPADGFRARIDAVLLLAACGGRRRQRCSTSASATGRGGAVPRGAGAEGALVIGIDVRPDAGAAGRRQRRGERTCRPVRRFYLWRSALRRRCGCRRRLSTTSWPIRHSLPQRQQPAAADPARAQAMVEGEVPLAGWLEFCLKMVKTGGTVTRHPACRPPRRGAGRARRPAGRDRRPAVVAGRGRAGEARRRRRAQGLGRSADAAARPGPAPAGRRLHAGGGSCVTRRRCA